MDNAKNRLHELVKDLGHFEKCVSFKGHFDEEKQEHNSETTLSLNDGRVIIAHGTGDTKKAAQIQSCEKMMEIIGQDHPDLYVDWTQVKVEAQAGDSLIKLCAYLAEDMPSAEDKSIWLQEMESDSHMVDLFDTMHKNKHPAVVIFGNNLGAKKKATWIEALIWRQFGSDIISPDSGQSFNKIADFLGGKTREIQKSQKEADPESTSFFDYLMTSLSKIFSRN